MSFYNSRQSFDAIKSLCFFVGASTLISFVNSACMFCSFFFSFILTTYRDTLLHVLQFLDVINMKDPTQKAHFYKTTLREALPFIPRVSAKL